MTDDLEDTRPLTEADKEYEDEYEQNISAAVGFDKQEPRPGLPHIADSDQS